MLSAEQAQRTPVLPLPALLDTSDLALVHGCASACAEAGGGRDLKQHSDRWETLYLHTEGRFQRDCAGVLAKIVAGVRQAEAAEPTMRALPPTMSPHCPPLRGSDAPGWAQEPS